MESDAAIRSRLVSSRQRARYSKRTKQAALELEAQKWKTQTMLGLLKDTEPQEMSPEGSVEMLSRLADVLHSQPTLNTSALPTNRGNQESQRGAYSHSHSLGSTFPPLRHASPDPVEVRSPSPIRQGTIAQVRRRVEPAPVPIPAPIRAAPRKMRPSLLKPMPVRVKRKPVPIRRLGTAVREKPKRPASRGSNQQSARARTPTARPSSNSSARSRPGSKQRKRQFVAGDDTKWVVVGKGMIRVNSVSCQVTAMVPEEVLSQFDAAAGVPKHLSMSSKVIKLLVSHPKSQNSVDVYVSLSQVDKVCGRSGMTVALTKAKFSSTQIKETTEAYLTSSAIDELTKQVLDEPSTEEEGPPEPDQSPEPVEQQEINQELPERVPLQSFEVALGDVTYSLKAEVLDNTVAVELSHEPLERHLKEELSYDALVDILGGQVVSTLFEVGGLTRDEATEIAKHRSAVFSSPETAPQPTEDSPSPQSTPTKDPAITDTAEEEGPAPPPQNLKKGVQVHGVPYLVTLKPHCDEGANGEIHSLLMSLYNPRSRQVINRVLSQEQWQSAAPRGTAGELFDVPPSPEEIESLAKLILGEFPGDDESEGEDAEDALTSTKVGLQVEGRSCLISAQFVAVSQIGTDAEAETVPSGEEEVVLELMVYSPRTRKQTVLGVSFSAMVESVGEEEARKMLQRRRVSPRALRAIGSYLLSKTTLQELGLGVDGAAAAATPRDTHSAAARAATSLMDTLVSSLELPASDDGEEDGNAAFTKVVQVGVKLPGRILLLSSKVNARNGGEAKLFAYDKMSRQQVSLTLSTAVQRFLEMPLPADDPTNHHAILRHHAVLLEDTAAAAPALLVSSVSAVGLETLRDASSEGNSSSGGDSSEEGGIPSTMKDARRNVLETIAFMAIAPDPAANAAADEGDTKEPLMLCAVFPSVLKTGITTGVGDKLLCTVHAVIVPRGDDAAVKVVASASVPRGAAPEPLVVDAATLGCDTLAEAAKLLVKQLECADGKLRLKQSDAKQ